MATDNNNAIAIIENTLFDKASMVQFEEVLPRPSTVKPYLRSVMIAVEQRPELQLCTAQSIMVAALRAATLRLSCDPAVKQAYLVPRNISRKVMMGGRTTYIKQWEAGFQPHYLGLFTLAVRTNQYLTINVLPIGAGYEVRTKTTGETVIVRTSDGAQLDYVPECDPHEAQIWYGFLRTLSGFSHTTHWTVEQIEQHAKTYAPSYSHKDSLWHDPKHKHTMQKKTVLIDLLNWGIKTVDDTSSDLVKAMNYMNDMPQDDVIDAEATDPTQALPHPVDPTTTNDGAQSAGNTTTDGGADKLFAKINMEMASEKLKKLIEHAKQDPTTAFWKARSAARLNTKEANRILNAVAQDFTKAFVYLAMIHGTKIKD